VTTTLMAREMETSGQITQPAEPLVVLCLLAQRAKGSEPELESQRDTAQDPWKSGERTCDSDTAARNESEETTRLAENLNREIRTLPCRSRFPAARAALLGLYSEDFARDARGNLSCYDWCLQMLAG
jgi:hypothetical protein